MESLSFDTDIQIVDWSRDKVLDTIPAKIAYQIMGRSQRFPHSNLTAAVRTLAMNDADKIGIPYSTPVCFRAEPTPSR